MRLGDALSTIYNQKKAGILIEPNHAAGVKLIFLILTVASAGILFYYVTAALKMSKRKPYG